MAFLKPDMPDQPNMAELIPQQEASNLRQFDTMLQAMRPTSVTPSGTTSWERSPGTVNSEAFAQALQDWEAQQSAYNTPQVDYAPQINGDTSGTTVYGGASTGPMTPPGPRPQESDFMEGGNDWTVRQELAPGEQQIYDTDQANRLLMNQQISTGLGNLARDPLDTSKAPAGYSADPARLREVSDALFEKQMNYIRPEQERQSRGLREDLMSQGFNFLDDAVQNPMGRLRDTQGRQVNDAAYNAVIGSGTEDSRLMQLSEALRSNRLREMYAERNQPLTELNALRTGAQPVTNYGQAQYSAPGLPTVDVLGANNTAYGNAVEGWSANAQANSNIFKGLLDMGKLWMTGGMM